ncbi:MAG: MlaC/ttg2D family ABC transporter substrate-binding protein [Gammaproteobacteria bacterium]
MIVMPRTVVANMNMWRRSVLCFLFTTLIVANIGMPLSAATNAVPKAPDVAVRAVFDELLGRLAQRPTNGPLSQDEIHDIFFNLLSPHIDYETLARWILREHWSVATAEQHEAFISAFQNYIINTYALALSADQKIILDVKENPLVKKNLAVVDADLSIAESDAVPLTFRLLQRGDLWKLFDVSFSGVSLAKTFRSDFSYVAQDGGIDAVTSFLLQRQAENKSLNE